MKIIIAIVFTAMLSLFIGYKIYPLVNANSSSVQSNSLPDKISESNEIISNDEKQSLQNISQSTEITAEASKPDYPEVSTVKSRDITGNYNVINEATVQTSYNEVEEAIPLDEQELQQWSLEHTERLLEQIDAISPDFVAEEMKKTITKKNDFLNNPVIQQDPTEDSNWVFAMEQYLTDFISTHELGDDFEIYNLTCKQLRCGIFGLEKNESSWRKIFMDILQNTPNIVIPVGKDNMIHTSFHVDTTSYVYLQLEFKRH